MAVPPRVADSLEDMVKNGVIEEHLSNEPVPWVSCAVIVPKDDGSLRVTLDAGNLNKALTSTNKTAVDVFGPLPSKNHIVVIQDLISRYPIAKLVKSTNASQSFQGTLPLIV